MDATQRSAVSPQEYGSPAKAVIFSPAWERATFPGCTSGRLKLQLPHQARSGHAGPNHCPMPMPPTAVAAPPRKSSRIGRPAQRRDPGSANFQSRRKLPPLPLDPLPSCVPSGPEAGAQWASHNLSPLEAAAFCISAVDHGPSPPSLFLVATWKLEGRFESR